MTPHDLFMRCHSACQKSLAEFRVRRREINIIRFLPRHVRGRKHFTRSERRIVRYQRTTEAQNAAKLSRKSGEATFSTVSATPHDLFMRCHYIHGYSLICCPETSSRSSRPRPSAPRAADSGSDADSPRPCRRGQAPSAYPSARADTAPKTLP